MDGGFSIVFDLEFHHLIDFSEFIHRTIDIANADFSVNKTICGSAVEQGISIHSFRTSPSLERNLAQYMRLVYCPSEGRCTQASRKSGSGYMDCISSTSEARSGGFGLPSRTWEHPSELGLGRRVARIFFFFFFFFFFFESALFLKK